MKKKIIAVVLAVIITAAAAGGALYYRDCMKKLEIKGSQLDVDTIAAYRGEPAVKLAAHRGLSSAAPENTLAALEKAGEAGFFAAEFDIHETSDGELVVIHNADIKDMTDGKGLVSEMTYSELMKYNIDAGNHIDEYPGLKIPTLEQALDVCVKYSIVPMVEIKECTDAGLDKLLMALDERNLRPDSIIIAFGHEYLEKLEAKDNTLELWYLVSDLNDENLEICKKAPQYRVAFDGRKEANRGAAFDKYKAAGLELAAWTIDDADTFEAVYSLGVGYITSNRICP
ncbi:MAG: hypothetical protein GX851_03720 [Clostridiales bacterium]|nr:hypothetical protein [Clostridiales bacterium]